MEPYSFQRYLIAKRPVDDRALNRNVWNALEDRLGSLTGRPLLQVLEMGAGVGTMFQRLVEWGLLQRCEYALVDENAQNISIARERIGLWAQKQGLEVRETLGGLALSDGDSAYFLEFSVAEMEAYLENGTGRQWDLWVANAFLDLVDTRMALLRMRDTLRPGGLLYLTINFDGMTAFEPPVDPDLDEKILALYHRTMDERAIASGWAGGSLTGRRMFSWLGEAGLRILEAGSSDWIVYPRDGRYQGDEAYFLRHILYFFEESLSARSEIDPGDLSRWLAARRMQLERGELVYLAHQFDFLAERL